MFFKYVTALHLNLGPQRFTVLNIKLNTATELAGQISQFSITVEHVNSIKLSQRGVFILTDLTCPNWKTSLVIILIATLSFELNWLIHPRSSDKMVLKHPWFLHSFGASFKSTLVEMFSFDTYIFAACS